MLPRAGLRLGPQIASWAQGGRIPSHGHRPDPLQPRPRCQKGMRASDLDLVEANEAFAAQACAVDKDMGWDPAKVNVNGGAIAIGHPIAPAARHPHHLLYEMGRRNAKRALPPCASAAAMGIALTVER